MGRDLPVQLLERSALVLLLRGAAALDGRSPGIPTMQ
jgi:hypothetical protein